LAGTRLTTFFIDLWAAFLDVFFSTLDAFLAALGAFDVLPAATKGFNRGRTAFPFKTSFNIALGPNRTPREAAMATGAPVCGLRPIRAPRRVGLKLPKLATTTRRPDLTSLTTAWISALTASSASPLVNDVVLLTVSMSSDLFTTPPRQMQSH